MSLRSTRAFAVSIAERIPASGEYYSVGDDVWAASGLAPHGGMLCLACLERRIGRPLTGEDFTALWPAASAWERHIAARTGCADPARLNRSRCGRAERAFKLE